jgi:peptide/nickel transport system ATP-binding protein
MMAEDKDLILDIKDLKVEYRTRDGLIHAVNGINLSIHRGTTLGLVGETGAGKTTTALSIMRLIRSPPGAITAGSIKFNGKDVLSMNAKEMLSIRGKEISMVFQDPMTSLNPVLTVGDQIKEVILAHNHITKAEAGEKTEELLEMVGIAGNRHFEYPHQFSGGMKQRVVIAIALACNPKLLIADEPTTALDVTIQAQVLKTIQQLREKLGTSMLLITHDLGIVAEVCDEVSVMYAGTILEYGNLEDVFNYTMHPYTEGLFNSLPKVNKRGVKLKPIPGLVPDPANLPPGCPFEPRCSYTGENCRAKKPEGKWVSATHYVACYGWDRPGFALTGGTSHD